MRIPLFRWRRTGTALLGSGALYGLVVLLLPSDVAQAAAAPTDRPLRVICFGAHPDDCEIKAGGVAALFAARGHKVKFVSTTNGDIGHWRDAGAPLARRRKAEVERTAEILNVTSEVLDIHDGELMPTLENRRWITRLIREWKADIVMSPRPNDYHPDHRYTAILVQDAAFMVTVPFFCPDVPALPTNPLFLYYRDDFKKPQPFQPDIVVDVTPVIGKKLDALDALESQFYEGGAGGSPELLPTDPARQAERRKEVRARFERMFRSWTEGCRAALKATYGDQPGGQIQFAEAFEICEYGGRPSAEQLKQLFPFAGTQ